MLVCDMQLSCISWGISCLNSSETFQRSKGTVVTALRRLSMGSCWERWLSLIFSPEWGCSSSVPPPWRSGWRWCSRCCRAEDESDCGRLAEDETETHTVSALHPGYKSHDQVPQDRRSHTGAAKEEFPEVSAVAQIPQVSFGSYSQFHQIKTSILLIRVQLNNKTNKKKSGCITYGWSIVEMAESCTCGDFDMQKIWSCF